ncbi:MAG: NosD domain-containing protein [Candidatus Thermoplasmatota archaeon]
MKKITVCSIVAVFLLSSLVGFSCIDNVKADAGKENNTLYVGGTSAGDYSTIQNAIENASSGDTVYVYSGIYYENIKIGKSISLEGEGKDDTIIDAGGDSDVVEITSEWINISGFTLRNGGGIVEKYGVEAPVGWGIFLKEVSNCCIENNIITNTNSKGIHILLSNNNIIQNNQIKDVNNSGIYLRNSDGNHIIGNSINDGKATGICLSSSNENLVEENSISDVDLQGIFITSSGGNNLVSKNLVKKCQYGIGVSSGKNNVIQGNTLKNNEKIGFYLASSQNNIVKNNAIQDNVEKGVKLFSSNNNSIYHNNIINNTKSNVEDNGENNWYNTTLKEGNYYSDYNGEDNDGDRIGDTSYNITGGNQEDPYPLMEPVTVDSDNLDESKDDKNGGTKEESDGKNKKDDKDGIPGFELLLLVFAAICFVFWRKRREN